MIAARRLTLVSLISLCALAGLLVLARATAHAAVTHTFLPEPSKRFGEDGLTSVDTMSVDSGELYIGEGQYSPSLRKFDAATGALTAQLSTSPPFPRGLAVGHSTGEAELYVVGIKGEEAGEYRSQVAVLDAAGALQAAWTGADTPSGSFGDDEVERGSVAVDESGSLSWAAGDVYVADLRGKAVDVFKPTAGGGEEYVTRLEGPEPPNALFASPLSVAVDQANDEVLVVDGEYTGGDTVDIFKPTAIVGGYEFAGKLHGPPGTLEGVTGVTVDNGSGPGAGDIYVSDALLGVVEEFDAAGDYLGHLSETPAGPLASATAVAVDPSTHDVYVGVAGEDVEAKPGSVAVFGPNVVIPDVLTEAVSSLKPASVTLNGEVDPDGEGPASCRFVWGTTEAFGEATPCTGPVGGPGAVHVTLSGLQPDTTYYYRLQATNKNGTNNGESWQDRQFTTPGAGLGGETVSDVASTSATLGATLDPHGAPTSYYFEYGRSTAYEAQAPLAPGIALGSGEGAIEVSRHIQGLAAGTVYHYRVVAVSDLELEPGVHESVAFNSPDQTFTTQSAGAFALPDERQWELVTPVDKHGAAIQTISETGLVQSSVSGAQIAYLASVPITAAGQGRTESVQVISTRGADGWTSLDIATPHASATQLRFTAGPEYRAFSEDLSLGVVEPYGETFTSLAPDVSPPDTERTDYLRHDATCVTAPDSCFTPLLTGAPGYADVPPGTAFGGSQFAPAAEFVGGSPDLRHVILGSPIALTSTASRSGLYEWSADKPPAERLQLVSVLPGGETAPGGASLGNNDSEIWRAVSADGSRVFWTGTELNGVRHLYVRDTVKGETIQLDSLQPGASESGEPSAEFQTASSDGSRVFFTDGQRLTATAGGSRGAPDLYECEIVEVGGKSKCDLSDLTPTHGGESAAVQGPVFGASEDGAYVYFAADGMLAEHATAGDCSSQVQAATTCNLYVWHNGVTKLVAVLAGADLHYNEGPNDLTERVSSDGDWLAFMSQRDLTAYSTRDAVSGNADEEVYLYDAGGNAAAGDVVCASCDPTGARPTGVEYGKLPEGGFVGGNAVWPSGTWLAANIPGFTPFREGAALHQSRYLSDEGRLFFNSSDALVPQDINGGEDVYEWEPTGAGGCSPSLPTFSPRSGGCVGLISAGTSAAESGFLDASENGDDVFFLTSERLVPQDVDTAVDVYDAHVCTAQVPCANATVSSPACTTADACRAAPAPQPTIFGAPSSATFSGAGNVVAARPTTAVRQKSLTRAQRLARALRTCHGKKPRKRAACERQARRRYGAKQSRKAGTMRRGGR